MTIIYITIVLSCVYSFDCNSNILICLFENAEISGNTNVPRQEVDVNSLLSKLLAAGLIKKTSENNSSDGRSSGGGLQPSEVSKKSEETDMEASEVVSLFCCFNSILLNALETGFVD